MTALLPLSMGYGLTALMMAADPIPWRSVRTDPLGAAELTRVSRQVGSSAVL